MKKRKKERKENEGRENKRQNTFCYGTLSI